MTFVNIARWLWDKICRTINVLDDTIFFHNFSDCGRNKTACEQKLDNFLNSFCKNITLAVTTTCPFVVPSDNNRTTKMLNVATTATPTPSHLNTLDQCRTTIMTTTVSLSCSQSQQPSAYQPACTCTSSAMSMESPPPSSSGLESSEKSAQTTCMNSAVALGALLALSVLLLAVVTIGWVCTCLITKKRQSPING